MNRPSVYVTTIRTIFGVGFAIGAFVHLRFAMTDPSFYGAFGQTALPPVDALWEGFVMPNIGWLPYAMAVFELAVGVAACLSGIWNRLAVVAMTVFFVFLLLLGFAFPAASLTEDLLSNRLGSLLMIALVLPWLLRRQPDSLPAAWAGLVRSRHAAEA